MTLMKTLCLSTFLASATLAPAAAQHSPDDVTVADFPFVKTVLTEGLGNPFEIRLGPDGWLWATERTSGKVTRVDLKDGTTATAYKFDEPEVFEVPEVIDGQAGVMGFAFHPMFGKGTDQLFVYHTYYDETRTDPTQLDENAAFHRLFNKIVRFEYDAASGTLSNPTDILTGIPSSNDHNSGRMQIGPDSMIYLSVGDQGHNQLINWCRPIESQTLPTQAELSAEDHNAYQGKILRIALDGSIPQDNPEFGGVRSHVYSYGHRNPQGLSFASDGTLYSNEHGPDSDDEINIIKAGGNYGWPHIAGQQDDHFYLYAQWGKATEPCETLVPIGPSQGAPEVVPQQLETEWVLPDEYVKPVATMFTVSEALPGCDDFGYLCRPSVGPSSITLYEGDGVAELSGRLLTTTLKHGSIYTIEPDAEEKGFTRYYLGPNRLRDLAISDDGTTIYLATDLSGGVIDPEGGVVPTAENPGAILVYTAK